MILATYNKMKSSSSYSSHQQLLFNGLSESLLSEILLRVPSRALHRLKSVCKTWNSLISSHYFVMSFNHRRHDPSLPPIPPDPDHGFYGLILQLHHRRLNSLVLDDPRIVHFEHTGGSSCPPVAEYRAHRVLDLSFLPHPQSKIEVRASFADLLLCSLENRSNPQVTYFYVCNILTKQWLALPGAHHNSFPMSPEPIGLLCVHAPCSLCRHNPKEECGGKDNSRYEFAVVRILTLTYDPNVLFFYRFRVQLYISGKGLWRNYVVSPLRGIKHEGFTLTSMVAYRGMLHFLFDSSISVYDPFDSPERLTRIIDLPPPPLSRWQYPRVVRSLGLRLGGDHLCVAISCDVNDPMIYLWDLEDYDMGKWSLLHKIHHRNLNCNVSEKFLNARYMELIFNAQHIHIDGNAICALQDSSLWLCNIQRRTMDRLHNYAFALSLDRLSVHPVVNQWWPTPVLPPLPMQPCTSKNYGSTNTTGKLKKEGEK